MALVCPGEPALEALPLLDASCKEEETETGSVEALGEQTFNCVRDASIVGLQRCLESLDELTGGRHKEAAFVELLGWRNFNGVTALILAARNNLPDFVEKLLEHGANVHDVNPVPQELCAENQGSALHEAAHKGYLEMVELLVQRGADPWAANTCGLSAFDLAQQSKRKGIITFLKGMALYCGTMRVKSCMHYYDSVVGMYKPCEVVVTPYMPFPNNDTTPILKKVYLFKGRRCYKAKAVLTYEAAEIFQDRTGERVRLRMEDVNGLAVSQQFEEGCNQFQTLFRKATTVALAVAPFGCTLVLANIIATASPLYFQLKMEGRRPWSYRPRGVVPLHTDVFFRPAKSTQNYERFIECLEGPRNQAFFLAALSNEASAEQLRRWCQSGVLDMIPRHLPEDLEHSMVEPICVICLSEPVTRGFLHGNSMHACVCKDCVTVALPGFGKCPMCRAPVEGLAAL